MLAEAWAAWAKAIRQMTAEAWAAWAQAILSAAAIFASYWIIRVQESRQVRRRAKAVATVLEDIETDGGMYWNDFQGIQKNQEWSAHAWVAAGAFGAKRTVLERLDLALIDDPIFWKKFANFSAEIDTLIRVLNEHHRIAGDPNEAPDDAKMLRSLKTHFQLIEAQAKDSRRALERAYGFQSYFQDRVRGLKKTK
jgi:hypothetical protein